MFKQPPLGPMTVNNQPLTTMPSFWHSLHACLDSIWTHDMPTVACLLLNPYSFMPVDSNIRQQYCTTLSRNSQHQQSAAAVLCSSGQLACAASSTTVMSKVRSLSWKVATPVRVAHTTLACFSTSSTAFCWRCFSSLERLRSSDRSARLSA